MYKGKPQLIIMLVRPGDHLSNTVHGWRHAHYFVCSTVCSHWHSRSSISGLEKRVIWSLDKYMQSLPPGKLQVCQLIQNKVNQDLPRAKKIRELLSCLNSKVEFKISFKPCYITYNIYAYLSDTRMQKPATLQAYHGIDNPDNKWANYAWIIFEAANGSIASNRKMKVP